MVLVSLVLATLPKLERKVCSLGKSFWRLPANHHSREETQGLRNINLEDPFFRPLLGLKGEVWERSKSGLQIAGDTHWRPSPVPGTDNIHWVERGETTRPWWLCKTIQDGCPSGQVTGRLPEVLLERRKAAASRPLLAAGWLGPTRTSWLHSGENIFLERN